MTRLETVRVEARSSAPPEVVFAIVTDATTWSTWAGPLVIGSGWERGGPQGGVGAVRRLGRGPLAVRERVVELEPPRRMAYELLSWQPYRDYLGEVMLHPDGGGTRITWTVGFRPRVPGTGAAGRQLLQRVVGDFASRLAAYAGASASPGVIGKDAGRRLPPSTGELP